MGRILEQAEKEFLKKCADARIAAVKGAAKEIERDFKKKVFDQAVTDYYNEYKPTRYRNRKKSLYKAFKVFSQNDGENISITFNYDTRWLPPHESNSKYHKTGPKWVSRYSAKFNWDVDEDGKPIGDNGIPGNAWIFTNFMEGIHPRYYLDRDLDVVINDSVQFEAAYVRMKNYRDEYMNGGDAREILIKHLHRQYVKRKR